MTEQQQTHFSFSQLSEYSRCSKAYQLRRKQAAPTKPAAWLVGGSAVHAAIEAANYNILEGKPVELDATWKEAWDTTLQEFLAKHPDPSEYRTAGRKTKETPNGHDLDWWQENGPAHVQAWLDFAQQHNWKPASFDGVPAIEFDIASVYGWGDDTFLIKGFVDAVMQQPDGTFVLVDYKTGARPVSTTQQLGLYACSMERLGMPRPKYGAYFMTRTASFGTFHNLDQYTVNYFDDLFSRLAEGVNQQIFLPYVGDHCRICDVSEACFAYGGTSSRLYDPDHPEYNPVQK